MFGQFIVRSMLDFSHRDHCATQVWEKQLTAGQVFASMALLPLSDPEPGSTSALAILVPTHAGALCCLAAASGATLWQVWLGTGPISSPAAVRHVLREPGYDQQGRVREEAAILGRGGGHGIRGPTASTQKAERPGRMLVAVASNSGCITVLALLSGLEEGRVTKSVGDAATPVVGTHEDHLSQRWSLSVLQKDLVTMQMPGRKWKAFSPANLLPLCCVATDKHSPPVVHRGSLFCPCLCRGSSLLWLPR